MDSFKAQLARAGQVVETLPEPPKLDEVLEFYLTAFMDLCTTRVNGMGIAPISVLAVDQYADRRAYDAYQFYFLHYVVRTLDPVYIENASNELKRNKPRK